MDYYADADTFEILVEPLDPPAVTVPTPRLAPSITELEPPPGPETPGEVSHLDSGNLGTRRPLVIDEFPFGNLSAPIDGPDSPIDSMSQGDPNCTSWAPFCSQLDWEFAQWAKLQGVSASALNDLLTLPEVRPHPFSIIFILTKVLSSLTGWGYRTKRQMN